MVWLIGYKGMLGSEIAKQLTENKIDWIGSDKDVDITNPAELSKFAHNHGTAAGRTGISVARGTVPEKITWVINCAAYTAVDKAEEDSELAEKLNYSDKTISKWERAESSPDISVLVEIANL